MFRFPTHADANNALGIRSMTFDGVPVTLRVPFKFWKATDNKYFPPAQARQYIESGDWYRSRIGNHGFSVSENYQLQESGMSEHSIANSEAANQPPTSQFVSTNERCEPNLSAPVFEESATSDVDDTGVPFGGYSGPVLPSLSEASTPRKYSAVAQNILDAGVDDEQASQTGPLSVSDVTSTGATPVVGDVSVESASPSTQRASSPLNAAMIENVRSIRSYHLKTTHLSQTLTSEEIARQRRTPMTAFRPLPKRLSHQPESSHLDLCLPRLKSLGLKRPVMQHLLSSCRRRRQSL
ncbi:unnamed protein product [Aureobasidium pullulans]|nr:unnamed protein product [Aureobasidium pullulans]